MTQELIGLLLMLPAVAYACWAVLMSKDGKAELNIFVVAILTAIWLIGRVTAGRGIFDMLLS